MPAGLISATRRLEDVHPLSAHQSHHISLCIYLFCVLGSVYGGPGAEAPAGQAEHRSLQPAPPDSSGRCHGSEKPTSANETGFK